MPAMHDLCVTTFVIRIRRQGAGPLSGVVERVSDGLKEALPQDLAELGAVIAGMLPAVETGGAAPPAVLSPRPSPPFH